MDNSLRLSIEAILKSKTGFEFEALIKEIHLIRYGSDGFMPTRERRDEGADGIITESRTVVASYAPDKYDEKEFIKKADGDFDSYLDNWANDYPNWVMYYNGSLSPIQIKTVNDKLVQKANERNIKLQKVLIKGVDQIVQLCKDELSNKQIRQLATHLGVPKELIIFDNIREIIDDLIRGLEIDFENISYNSPVDIDEKIQLNYSVQDAKIAKEEYEDLIISGDLKKIGAILSSYTTEELNILKLRIKREFNKFSGGYKNKINNLVESYLFRYANEYDDDFEHYTRALLVYCFEQCIIGEKTKGENKLN